MSRDMRNYVTRGFEDALTAAGFDPRKSEVRHAIANAVSPIAMEFGLRDRLIRDLLDKLYEWRSYALDTFGADTEHGRKLEALEARARIVLDEAEGEST